MLAKVRNYSWYLVFSLALMACNEDEENITISDEAAAEQVSSVITSDVVGLVGDIDYLLVSAEAQSARVATCGNAYDTTIMFSYEDAFISLGFDASYSYGLNCDGIIPTSLFANFSSSSEYEGSRIITSGNTTGMLTATGLLASEYTVNGSFTRVGNIEQKRGEQNSFSSTFTVTITDLTIGKELDDVTGGTLSLTVEGESRRGVYSFTSNVMFNDDGEAMVTINNGTQYLVDIESGDITELN